jgi:carboxylate-amine ligase
VSRQILASGAAQDLALLNYEVRLSTRYPTVEFRVTDVCTDVEDALTIAGLVRALVETAAASSRDATAIPAWRSDVLRSWSWRAARSGLSGGLHDPVTGERRDASFVAGRLCEHTRVALESAGDLARVSAGIESMLSGGNGAQHQRRVHDATQDLTAVVGDLVRRTS